VIGQVGKDARHPDEADLALGLQFPEGLDRAVLLKRRHGRGHVHLDQVDTVGAGRRSGCSTSARTFFWL
jgi:hypothetical protein